MKVWFDKNKNSIALSIIFIFCLIIGKIVFAFFKEYLTSFIYGANSSIILNRAAYFVGEVSYISEYFQITGSTIILTCLIIIFLTVYGSIKLIRCSLILMAAFLTMLMLVVFYINIAQFLIIVLPIISSYIYASVFIKKLDLIDKINFTFLVLCCQIIIISVVLSLFKAINANNFLIASIFIFSISVLFRKQINDFISFDIEQIKLCKINSSHLIKTNKLLSVFLCAILISILWRLYLIVYMPANDTDGMEYHLVRVAYWIQNHSLNYYFTQNLRQVLFPFNAEIMMLWTMIASKLDYLCGFIQFICYLLSGTLIYKCLRQYLKVDQVSSAMTVLIWYSLPLVVIESTNTKNNIFLSYFIMYSLVYFFAGGF